jgi:hypothetical protein
MAVTPNSIVTPQTVVSGTALCTSANTNYASPTAVVQLLTAQTNGARITSITALALTTVTATELQLYKYDGTTYKFIKSVLMSAYTVAQTTAQSQTDFGYTDSNPLFLSSTDQLYVGIGVALATGIRFHAYGGAY